MPISYFPWLANQQKGYIHTYNLLSSGTTTNNLASNNTSAKHSVLRKLADSIKGIKKLTTGSNLLGRATATRGGAEKTFRRRFDVRQGEELVKACECHLLTTAGPISGFLFISSDKLAFCSLKVLRLSSFAGGDDKQSLRFHYKVVIPLNKIKAINRSRNQECMMKKTSLDKYLRVVTKDQFEFWFYESSSC